MSTKDQREAEVVRILRAVRHADRERHTVLIRDLAVAMVDLREHYLTPEGQPDWSGRTWAYRAAIRSLYARADYPHEERTATQATVRYHIGNLIRRRLSTSELAPAGIRAPGLHERQTARRQRASAMLAALTSDAPHVTSFTGTITRLRETLAILSSERIDKSRIAAPENAQAAEAIVRMLVAIRDRSASLVDEIGRAGIEPRDEPGQ